MLNPLTHRKVLKKGMPGHATIVEIGVLNRGSTSFNLPMTLQVFVEGMTPYEVEDQWMVKAKDTGGLTGTIPVKMDREDPQKVAIDWDGVRAKEAQETQARQEALAAQGPWTGGAPPGNISIQGGVDPAQLASLGSSLGAALGAADAAQAMTPSIDLRGDPVLREKIERVLGRNLEPGTTERVAENDPEMQMRIMQIVSEHMAEQAGGGGQAMGFASRGAGDSGAESGSAVEQLERLAALRDRGVLTDAEFEQQKAQILSQG